MWALLREGLRVSSQGNNGERAVGSAVAAAVIVFVPMHFVSSYFVTSGMPQLLWALAGLVFGSSAARAAGRGAGFLQQRRQMVSGEGLSRAA